MNASPPHNSITLCTLSTSKLVVLLVFNIIIAFSLFHDGNDYAYFGTFTLLWWCEVMLHLVICRRGKSRLYGIAALLFFPLITLAVPVCRNTELPNIADPTYVIVLFIGAWGGIGYLVIVDWAARRNSGQ